MKRKPAEVKLQEKIESMADEVQKQLNGVEGKFDHITSTLASLQLQLLNMGNGENESGSILVGGGHQYSSGGKTPHMRYRLQNDTGDPLFITPLPKLDFSRFDGMHPRAWILKCQGYFKLIPNVPDHHQKVIMAAMHFEGKASMWYQNLTAKHTELSWS